MHTRTHTNSIIGARLIIARQRAGDGEAAETFFARFGGGGACSGMVVPGDEVEGRMVLLLFLGWGLECLWTFKGVAVCHDSDPLR